MIENYSIVVVGCTKDSGSYIFENLRKLYEMHSFFKDFQMIIYENDSSDNTVEELERFASKYDKFKFISEKNVLEQVKKDLDNRQGKIRKMIAKIKKHRIDFRTQILAYARNKLINLVNTEYNSWDYVIVSDLDSLLVNFKAKQIKSFFLHDETKWDVLTSNSFPTYYDIWALRISNKVWQKKTHARYWRSIIDYDCWEMVSMAKKGEKRKEAIEEYVKNNQITISQKKELIPVDSAFGGMGVYKISKISNCKYDGLKETLNYKFRFDRCEHVAFHEEIRNKNDGKIFICSNFVLTEQTE